MTIFLTLQSKYNPGNWEILPAFVEIRSLMVLSKWPSSYRPQRLIWFWPLKSITAPIFCSNTYDTYICRYSVHTHSSILAHITLETKTRKSSFIFKCRYFQVLSCWSTLESIFLSPILHTIVTYSTRYRHSIYKVSQDYPYRSCTQPEYMSLNVRIIVRI